MKTKRFNAVVVLALLLLPAMLNGQEQPAERGNIELGVRGVWGEVYGRPDLPFQPSLSTSKFNEYRDVKNGFFIRSFVAHADNIFGSKTFVSLQSKSTIYKDQSFLATLGEYGKYKIQFRWDETPHTFTDTARTLFTQTSPGVYTFPMAIRTSLAAIPSVSSSLPLYASAVNGIIPSFSFITPSLTRKSGTGTANYNATENWDLNFLFSRENQVGSRPIGYIMNSSPSASSSGGYGVEVPEPIDYDTSQIKAGTEYGRETWAVQLGYSASLFRNNVSQVTFDNPFNTVDASGKPATGRAALYPDNSAQNVSFAGGFDVTKHIRVMGSVVGGWWSQNKDFLPYTSNTALLPLAGALPSAGPNAKRTTMAANVTVTSRPVKNLELTARYRQYDFNNDTPVREFTPIAGDAAAPNLIEPEENLAYAYFRKNFEAFGVYSFTKKSSVKLGYEWEGWDRNHRDVNHTGENSLVSSLDLNPRKDLQFRLAYRHSKRTPDVYENENEDLLPLARRFDQAARVRDRADASVDYTPIDRLTLSASYWTLQDNYNVADNSATGSPYGFMGGSGVLPYYSYGLLKDIGFNYNFGVDYAATKNMSFFAEYTRENYNTRMVSRQRGMIPNTEILDPASDTPGNDWASRNHDVVDTYATGVDLYMSKKVYVTTYYSLSAGKGLNFTKALGSRASFTDPTKFLVTTVLNFPETTSRIHEVGAVFKLKLTKNIMPKFEYRYQQFDNRDYQTNPMDQYMGVANPGAASFYPYINVADSSAARYIFLGADSPSYRAHYVAATLEYHF